MSDCAGSTDFRFYRDTRTKRVPEIRQCSPVECPCCFNHLHFFFRHLRLEFARNNQTSLLESSNYGRSVVYGQRAFYTVFDGRSRSEEVKSNTTTARASITLYRKMHVLVRRHDNLSSQKEEDNGRSTIATGKCFLPVPKGPLVLI